MASSIMGCLLCIIICLLLSSRFSVADNEISAAPALLPSPTPSSSPPALSPDITPLFPSPSGGELSPTESSLPTIPSSPSPPNPDDVTSYGPNTMAISPSSSSSSSLPASSSSGSWNSGIQSASMAILGLFWSFYLSLFI